MEQAAGGQPACDKHSETISLSKSVLLNAFQVNLLNEQHNHFYLPRVLKVTRDAVAVFCD